MLSKIRNTHLSNSNIKCEQLGQLRRIVVLLTMTIFGSLSMCHAQTTNLAGGPPASNLKVMTWNIRGGEFITPKKNIRCQSKHDPRYVEHVAEEIERQEGLDVIALQEIYRGQANTLRQRLAGFLGAVPRLYFVETVDCGSGAAANDFGTAIISRYVFVDPPESRRLYVPFFCSPSEQRAVARVIIEIAGRPVHIYNAHLTTCGGSAAQTIEMFQIRDLVNRDRAQPRNFAFRAILMGDFNARPSSTPYKTIGPGLFLDAWREVHGDASGLTFDTFKPYARIDYVLPSSGGVFRVDDAQVASSKVLFGIFALKNPNKGQDFNRVPDHLPVVARLSIVDL